MLNRQHSIPNRQNKLRKYNFVNATPDSNLSVEEDWRQLANYLQPLRLTKVWEGEEPFIVWQVSPATKCSALPAKLYLRVDAHPKRPWLSLVTEKPGPLKAGGVLVTLLRKYAKTGALGWPLEDDATTNEAGKPQKHLLLPIAAKSYAGLFVRRLDTHPPELQLILNGSDVLARRSVRGSYTKKQNLDPEISRKLATLWQQSLNQEQKTASPVFAPQESPLFAAFAAMAHSHSSKIEADKNDIEETSEAVPPIDSAPSEAGLLPKEQRQLRDRLARRVKTLKRSAAKLANAVPDQQDIELRRTEALALQSVIHLVEAGQETVELPSTQDRGPLTATLDPGLSPGENIDQKFIAVKKLQRTQAMAGVQLRKVTAELAKAVDDLTKLRSGLMSAPVLDAMKERHGFKSLVSNSVAKVRQPARLVASTGAYRVYELPAGGTALVGRGPTDNDALTKNAKSNDWWIHTVDVTGSHVILKSRSFEGNSPTAAQLRQCGILALHYSKLRDDMAGEVYTTTKSNLRKTRNLAPGLWIVDKASTLFVRYEIEERQQILDRLVTA